MLLPVLTTMSQPESQSEQVTPTPVEPSQAHAHTNFLYVIFHFLSYCLNPSFLLLSNINHSPLLLILALIGTVILSNISAHLTTKDDNIIAMQFLYWVILWASLVNGSGEVFVLISQLPELILWLCLKLPPYGP
jgi:hypothetical protein